MKKSCRLMLICLLCTIASISPAYASEATHRAAVERLLLALKVQDNVSNYVEQVKASTEQMFKKMNVPESELAMATRISNRQLEIAQQEFSWQNMKDGIIASYMKVYSEEEVVELTKFFTSPIGTKYVNKQPQLSQEMSKAFESRLPIMAERYKRIPEEIAEEMSTSTTECEGPTAGAGKQELPTGAVAHVEGCISWDYHDNHYGATNICKDPLAVKFMLVKDEVVKEGEIGSGKVFDMGLNREQVEGNCTMFTACPVGYQPSVPFTVKNQELIQPGNYHCVKN